LYIIDRCVSPSAESCPADDCRTLCTAMDRPFGIQDEDITLSVCFTSRLIGYTTHCCSCPRSALTRRSSSSLSAIWSRTPSSHRASATATNHAHYTTIATCAFGRR
jgi:hypothetical protein